jgi:hypothetical protein
MDASSRREDRRTPPVLHSVGLTLQIVLLLALAKQMELLRKEQYRHNAVQSGDGRRTGVWGASRETPVSGEDRSQDSFFPD